VLPLGSGSTGAPARAAPARGLLDAAIGVGMMSSSQPSPGWDGAGIGSPRMERLRCGWSHNSRKLWTLHFFILNMRVATVSPDYLI